MGAIRGAARWVWDFVVGDWLLVGGAVIAILAGWALRSIPGRVAHDAAGPVFFVIVAAALAVSLWEGTRG